MPLFARNRLANNAEWCPVFRLEYLQYLSPKHWNIIGGCCLDNLPLYVIR
jgi:hypothetical protein